MLARIAHYLRPISMHQLSGCLVLLLLAGGLSGCLEDSPPSTTKPPTARATNTPKPAPARPTATPKPAASNSNAADWTVLVYLDGDNNLEEDAIGDYAEMSSVGSNARLNIVVQFDRIASDEDWDDTWQSARERPARVRDRADSRVGGDVHGAG